MLLLFCSVVLLEIIQKEANAEAIIVDSLKSTFRSFSLDYNHFATLSR